MASKSSQPALYEKMRQRSGSVSPPASLSPRVEVKADHSGGGGGIGSWLTPGRTVRIPGGYLILACGLAIILFTSAYVIGHKRGYGAAKVEIDSRLNGAIPAANDPLAIYQPVVETTSNAGRTPISPQNPALGMNSPQIGTNSGGVGAVVPQTDPRRKGMLYYVLMEGTESGAVQVAEFCRLNGLESYVVSDKNGRPRRVIAFPGFDASIDRSSKPVKDLLARIHAVDEKWQKEKKGKQNFSGAYLLEHK